MNYTGSGVTKTSGCAMTSSLVYTPYKWSVNSILYIKHKANKGILERVAIKRVILNSAYNQIVPIYQDTLNSLWNEDDLLIEGQARDLAIAYLELRESQIAEARCL